MRWKKWPKSGIEIVSSMICLENLNITLKLSGDDRVEGLRNTWCFGFVLHVVCPCQSSMVINKSYEPACTRYILNSRGPPNITVNQCKRFWRFAGHTWIRISSMFEEFDKFHIENDLILYRWINEEMTSRDTKSLDDQDAIKWLDFH